MPRYLVLGAHWVCVAEYALALDELDVSIVHQAGGHDNLKFLV